MDKNKTDTEDKEMDLEEDATLALHRAILAAQHFADGEGPNKSAENAASKSHDQQIPEGSGPKIAEADQETPADEGPAFMARNKY